MRVGGERLRGSRAWLGHKQCLQHLVSHHLWVQPSVSLCVTVGACMYLLSKKQSSFTFLYTLSINYWGSPLKLFHDIINIFFRLAFWLLKFFSCKYFFIIFNKIFKNYLYYLYYQVYIRFEMSYLPGEISSSYSDSVSP